MNETFGNILIPVLVAMGVCVVIALIGLLAMMRGIRRLRIPHEADFFTTMRHIPLSLVILLDLLDFGLDVFSAPIIWVVLDRMGLPNLRNKAALEALIPFTNVIPTFTASWLAARLLNLGNPSWQGSRSYWDDYPAIPFDKPFERLRDVTGARRDPAALPRRRTTIIDMDDSRPR